MSVPYVKRLKDPDAESTRLKMLQAQQVFESDAITDALRKSDRCAGAQAAGAEHGGEWAERAASAGAGADER